MEEKEERMEEKDKRKKEEGRKEQNERRKKNQHSMETLQKEPFFVNIDELNIRRIIVIRGTKKIFKSCSKKTDLKPCMVFLVEPTKLKYQKAKKQTN